MGTSEKTEFDTHFENLAERAECTKLWTEKIVHNAESVLTPNPGNRIEDFIFEKIEKKKPTRLSNLEYMGLDMIEVSKLIRFFFFLFLFHIIYCILIIKFNSHKYSWFIFCGERFWGYDIVINF